MDHREDFEPVIGLEIHCQLSTNSKLFCSCSTTFGAAANTQTCDVCLGMPGALPVLNEKAIVEAIKLALSLNGQIQRRSVFDRKQYFYQDLPKGYQISQYNKPYCLGGNIKLDSGKLIRLQRIHIEEDAGKSFHRRSTTAIDLNRAGIPLVEIVTEPDINTSAEAVDFFKKIQMIVTHLGVSDGIMEEGSLRCDANVSIRRKSETRLGTRCEIKNLNSFRFLEKAIDYEIERHKSVLRSGKAIFQETRLYDEVENRTIVMRTKEDSDDYRYFSDPDLRPLIIDKDWIDLIREKMPDLPEIKKKKLISLELAEADADIITKELSLSRFFDQVLLKLENYPGLTPKFIAQWVTTEVVATKSYLRSNSNEFILDPDSFLELLLLVFKENVTVRAAQSIFQTMLQTGEKPLQIVERESLQQISNEDEIISVVSKVIEKNARQVAEYLGGKEKVLAFFVGQVMRASHGRYSPNKVNQIIINELKKKKSNHEK